jgi:hypothetical protein
MVIQTLIGQTHIAHRFVFKNKLPVIDFWSSRLLLIYWQGLAVSSSSRRTSQAMQCRLGRLRGGLGLPDRRLSLLLALGDGAAYIHEFI